MKQGFIGFGNLTRAVYQGLKEEKGMAFAYFDRTRKETDILFYEQMNDLVSFADVIWLGIKPQDLSGILEQLKECNLEGKTIVSPVAGKSIAYIERYLGKDQLVVRIMPNLAMAYRKSLLPSRPTVPTMKKQGRSSPCWVSWVKRWSWRRAASICSPRSSEAALPSSWPLFRFLRIRCRSSTCPDR